jgi:hypothetical protein
MCMTAGPTSLPLPPARRTSGPVGPEATYPPLGLAAALALTPCPALGRLQSLAMHVPSLPADTLQLVCAQLTQLQSLSVVARGELCGPGGRPVPASELLGGLPALSRLTRLTSLTVEGRSIAGQGGPPPGNGAPVRDVLLALPPEAPLEEVRDLRGVPGWAQRPCWWFVL